MKKALTTVMIFTLLASLLFPLQIFANNNNSTMKSINLNLKMNMVDEVIKLNKAEEKSNLNNFGIDISSDDKARRYRNSENSKLKMSLKLKPQNQYKGPYDATATGFIQVDNIKYKLKADGVIEDDLIDGNNLLSGTMLLTVVDKNNKKIQGSLMMFYDEHTKQALVNITLGTLSSNNKNGLSYLMFGELFDSQKQKSINFKKNLDNKELNQTDDIIKSDFTALNTITTTNEWVYGDKDYTYYISSGTAGSGYASAPTAYVATYYRSPHEIDGSMGQEQVRVFGNISAVNDYYLDDNIFYLGATIASHKIEFGWEDTGVASINEVYPVSSSNGNTLSAIAKIFGSLLEKGTLLWDVTTTYLLGSTNSDPRQDTNGDGKYNWAIKTINTDDGDLPNGADRFNFEKYDGGVNADFQYSTWSPGATYTVYGKGQVTYAMHYVEWTNTFSITSGTATAWHDVQND